MSTLSIDQMPSRADQTFGIGNVLDEEFKPSLGLTSSSQQFARYTSEPAAPLSASLEALSQQPNKLVSLVCQL